MSKHSSKKARKQSRPKTTTQSGETGQDICFPTDVFLLTGSTLIEHSLEDAINAAKQARFKVVIGPTASWIPEIGFDLGLDAVCGMSFKDPDQAFRTIMQGGGTQSFSKYADKYTLTRKKASGQD